MKPYLLDTNIVLFYLRQDSRMAAIDALYDPMNPTATSILSVVSEGELRSLALQQNWGIPKMQFLENSLRKFLIADIHVKEIVERYAEIDAYSQGKLRSRPLGQSARNMGKNDLWIAATAAVLNVPLLTMDDDFQHLHNVFIDLKYIDLKTL